MMVRFVPFLAVLLAAVLVPPARADGFGDMRAAWNARQTGVGAGGTPLHGAMAEVLAAQCGQAATWLAQMDTRPEAKALWPDLGDWNNSWAYVASATVTGNHERLASLARMWATPGCDLYRAPALLAALLHGLDWMEAHHYHAGQVVYGNWWNWQIGSPLHLLNTLALLGDAVPPELLARQLNAVRFMVPDPRRRRRPDGGFETSPETGANLLDKIQVHVLLGMLGKSETTVTAAREALAPVLRYVKSGDGFYADGSFIQHGAVPYAGNYGAVALDNMARLIALLGAGPWPIRDPNLGNVYAWALDSFIPLVMDGAIAHAVRGRKVSQQGHTDHGVGRAVAATLAELAQTAPPATALQLRATVKGWMARDHSFGADYLQGAGKPSLYAMRLLREIAADSQVPAAPEPPGVRLFPSMDRAVLRGPGFGLVFSLFSPRISAFSYGNRENLHGWWTGAGMLSLYNADQSQFGGNFWPTVDWQRLPGTTTDHSAGGTPVEWHAYLNSAGWAGGTTLAGRHGVLGMDFSAAELTGSDLRGHKAWFLFGDKVLALGSGIHASRESETMVENRKLEDGTRQVLLVDGLEVGASDAPARLEGPAWAHLGGRAPAAAIGYCFPQRQTLVALREQRSGRWSDIHATQSQALVSERYLSLALPHGAPTGAEGAAYSYMLLPGASAADTAAYCSQPTVRIEDNAAGVAAASDDAQGLYAAVFWHGGASAHRRGAPWLASDQPAVVAMQEQGGELSLAVADPTQQAGQLIVDLQRPVAAVVSRDAGIEVLRLTPTLRLRISTAEALGRTFSARFVLPRDRP